MKKIILALALVISLNAISQTTLPEGTVIKVALSQDLNGKELSIGQKINFITSDDLILGDHIAIKQGTKVTGTVTDAAKSGMLAKRGKLSFSIDYLYLPDGKVLKLTSEVTKAVKSSTGVVVASAVLLSPLSLFIGGKNAKYKKGEVFEAYVKETATL